MKNRILLIALVLLASACQPPGADPATAGPTLQVGATAETEGTAADAANDPALLINPSNPAESHVVGSGDAGGLEIYTLDGRRIAASERPASFADVRYNFPLGGTPQSIIVTYDAATSELVAYVADPADGALRQVSDAMPTNSEIEGLCLYRSPLSGKFYAFAAGEGYVQQWELFDSGGKVAGRLTRTVPVGLGVAHCAVHDRASTIYFSQETVGVGKLNAEPESEAIAEYIDLSAPHGRFTGDVKGVALFEQAEGGYLVVSDADVSLLHLYRLDDDVHVGTIAIGKSAATDAVEETEGLAATSVSLSADYEGGVIVLADDDNDGEHTNYKLVAWRDVMAALGLLAGNAYDPTLARERSAHTVSPSAQTEPVQSFGDAADDPAIWVHPDDRSKSVVIGTQKKRGINVYDLNGTLLQSREDGRINNADLRYGFPLDGESVDIVSASNRTHDSISVWKVNPQTRHLEDIADGVLATGMADPYGQCMYRSGKTGNYYVFINDSDGLVRQWQLVDAGNGRIGAEQVREFEVGSQTEGCVADDETGALYVGEEDVGVWKYSAEPDGGADRTAVDSTVSGNLTDDVEGLSLYYGPNGSGYLIASNQGADNYAVYERQGDNRFLGHFHIVADEATGIDGVSETDGLDVTAANLGAAFPQGVLVVQDGRNITPDERQNFKLVPWERIAGAMGLSTDNSYDPRAKNGR